MVTRVAAAAVAIALAASGCGGGGDDGTGALHSERGVRTIEEIVAPQVGLGPLDASCDAPDGLGFGDTFECTAVTGDGQEILFLATIDDGAVIDIQSLNLLTPDAISAIEIATSDVLNIEQGLDVGPEVVDCGTALVRYEPGELLTMDCRVLHPLTGQLHAVRVDIADLLAL